MKRGHIRFVAWDLRGALLKKEEWESARLADFEFRLRVRTFRLLARSISVDEHEVVRLIAQGSDDFALEELGRRYPAAAATLDARYEESGNRARAELIRELGNPAAVKLL